MAFSPTAGVPFARKVTFDPAGRALTDTDATAKATSAE